MDVFFTRSIEARNVLDYLTKVAQLRGRVSLSDFIGLTIIMFDIEDNGSEKVGWTYEDIQNGATITGTREGYRLRMPDFHRIEPFTNMDKMLVEVYFAQEDYKSCLEKLN